MIVVIDKKLKSTKAQFPELVHDESWHQNYDLNDLPCQCSKSEFVLLPHVSGFIVSMLAESITN